MKIKPLGLYWIKEISDTVLDCQRGVPHTKLTWFFMCFSNKIKKKIIFIYIWSVDGFSPESYNFAASISRGPCLPYSQICISYRTYETDECSLFMLYHVIEIIMKWINLHEIQSNYEHVLDSGIIWYRDAVHGFVT
jgi:hypothetical protein